MSTRVTFTGANVEYTPTEIVAKHGYRSTAVVKSADGSIDVKPTETPIFFKTQRKVPRTGLMMIGWGGNNGTTVTGGILANKNHITWMTKKGERQPNYFGSISQSATIRVGETTTHEQIFVPLSSLVPMVKPEDIVLGGWDCSSMNIGDGMRRAAVYDIALQDKLYPLMKDMKPLPAIFDLEFIASNQQSRADNVIGGSKADWVKTVRGHIRDFKAANHLDTVIVLWTANTERWSEVKPGVHDTADHLLAALERGEAELAPSCMYAMAAILEGCSYVNGAPQNTFVPGLVELAERHHVFIAGDDFKSGQTKMKSALVEFFVGAGIKPECIASYNHLGNNDGRNLASPKQFRSKEISKSNVVDDMVASNEILYPKGSNHPDHCVVIKYMPYVGDSKRALDEYIFQIFMGGDQCIVMHNTCEDSLLAAPLIIDMCVFGELMQRITISQDQGKTFKSMRSVLSILSYFTKAPFVPAGTPVVNALNRQKCAIENLLRALVGLPPEDNMLLECKMRQ